MKKILSLLMIVVLVAGCNKEKTYKADLAGTWNVYKYLLYNVDQTQQFQNQHAGYYITFTADNKFTEYYTTTFDTVINGNLTADTVTTPIAGTYTFTNNDEMIVLDNTVTAYNLVDTVYVPYTYTNERKYTIFNLTADHVQLRNDSSQLYMSKKK
ncbi:MAG: hypothetical protein JWO06_657 [Bacteroidota bacterium]|nr:hypothetical protein [Bacteroidota bacterium]